MVWLNWFAFEWKKEGEVNLWGMQRYMWELGNYSIELYASIDWFIQIVWLEKGKKSNFCHALEWWLRCGIFNWMVFLSAYLYVWICMLVEYKIATLSPNCIWRVCAHTAHSTLSWLRSIFNCDWRACYIHASHIPCAQISTSIFLVSVTLEQTRPTQNRMQPGFFMAYSPLWSVDLLWNWNMCSRARHCRLRALT